MNLHQDDISELLASDDHESIYLEEAIECYISNIEHELSLRLEQYDIEEPSDISCIVRNGVSSYLDFDQDCFGNYIATCYQSDRFDVIVDNARTSLDEETKKEIAKALSKV